MFEFLDFNNNIWISDLSFLCMNSRFECWSMNFGYKFLFLGLGRYDLDLKFVKIIVGCCP